jgi:hypothetical protein
VLPFRGSPYHIVVGNAALCITAKLAADGRDGSTTAVISTPALGLLHLRNPTLAVRIGTSGSCQEQSFDDSVGMGEQHRRGRKAEGLRSLEIDDQLELARLSPQTVEIDPVTNEPMAS